MLPATLPALLVVAVAAFVTWRSIQNSWGGDGGGASDDPIGGWAVMNGGEPCERPSIGTTELLRHDLDEVVGLPYTIPLGPEGGAMYQLAINVGTQREPQIVQAVVAQAVLAAGYPRFSVYAKGDGLPKPVL